MIRPSLGGIGDAPPHLLRLTWAVVCMNSMTIVCSAMRAVVLMLAIAAVCVRADTPCSKVLKITGALIVVAFAFSCVSTDDDNLAGVISKARSLFLASRPHVRCDLLCFVALDVHAFGSLSTGWTPPFCCRKPMDRSCAARTTAITWLTQRARSNSLTSSERSSGGSIVAKRVLS